MSTRAKVLLGVALYFGTAILLLVIFGNDGKNEEFKPQDEFKLDAWLSIEVGGIDFSINRAVFYLLLASALTIFVMVWISRRMQQKPNRVQLMVELAYDLTRNNITAPTWTSGRPPGGFPSWPPCSSSSGSPT
jgi:F-type H+-transporting ATPase subunit a